jgi:hypothetical protein
MKNLQKIRASILPCMACVKAVLIHSF